MEEGCVKFARYFYNQWVVTSHVGKYIVVNQAVQAPKMLWNHSTTLSRSPTHSMLGTHCQY
jgi:hypothetical protein